MDEVKPAKQALLEEALRIVTGPRQELYGKPSQNFIDTADILNGVFCNDADADKFAPHDVAIIMICLKLARIKTSPGERDHWVDIAGYAACGWEAVAEPASACNAVLAHPNGDYDWCTHPAGHEGAHSWWARAAAAGGTVAMDAAGGASPDA